MMLVNWIDFIRRGICFLKLAYIPLPSKGKMGRSRFSFPGLSYLYKFLANMDRENDENVLDRSSICADNGSWFQLQQIDLISEVELHQQGAIC